MASVESLQDLIGLSLAEFTAKAKERGISSVRESEVDGEPRMLTMDFCPSRANVVVVTKEGTKIVTSVRSLS